MSDLVQMTFDYGLLSPETRIFVQEKTLAIKARLKRTAEDIIDTGKDLQAVKEALRKEHQGSGYRGEDSGNGWFLEWIGKEFEMSQTTAYNFMRVAKTFGEKLTNFVNISPSVLYELSAPSEETKAVREKVESGEIPPTLAEIRKVKEELRRAKVAEAKAQADAQAAQQQLFTLRDTSQHELDELTKQIKSLEEEIATITTPAIEIREVEKEVIPQSISLKLEKLQQERDRLTKEREQQAARIQKLNADLSVAVRKQVTAENNDRIRQGWRQVTSEAHGMMMRLLGQWPTPLDIRAFEADDWERLNHLKETLKRVLEECNNLHYSGDDMIIDSNGSIPTYALSLKE